MESVKTYILRGLLRDGTAIHHEVKAIDMIDAICMFSAHLRFELDRKAADLVCLDADEKDPEL